MIFSCGENMNINNQEVNIEDLFSDKYMHKEINKGLFLSDYQIEILNKYDIVVNKKTNVNDIIMQASEILDLDDDIDDLEQVIKEISEFNYYSNTNK